MPTETPLPPSVSTGESDSSPYPNGRGGWIKGSVTRVRQALVDRQFSPLTREEWAELRASLAAIRPPPPPSKLPHASSLF